MDKIRLNFIQELKTKAEKYKSQISNLYKEATELTFPSSDAYHNISNSSINMRDTSSIIFDDLSIEVSETLANQMELSMTRAGDIWANYSHPKPLKFQKENTDLREKTEEIFNFIHQSNFQQQISPVYRDLIIGTSALKLFVIKENGVKKIIYKHLNLGRVSFLENGKGQVDTFFYKIEDTTAEKVKQMLGVDELEVPIYISHEKDCKTVKTFNVIECCIPTDSGWEYSVVDDSFQFCFFKKNLKYNPYIVTRFSKRNDISTWGVGKAVERLSLIKSLQFFAKREMMVVDRDSRPPYLASTPNTKQPDLVLEPDVIKFLPMGTDIKALFTNIDLTKISNKIADVKAQLKQAFLIDSILEAQAQNTYKTATEIQIANQKFLDKFSTYASSIEEELPKQIFMRTYQLLSEEGMIKKIDSKIEKVVKYSNPIVIGQKQKEVDKLIQFAQTAIGIVGQENLVSSMDVEKIIPWLVDKMSVDPQLFFDTDTTNKNLEEMGQLKNAQDQQLANQASGGMINSEDLGIGGQ